MEITDEVLLRLQRHDAVHEILNLMGRYETYHFVRSEIAQTVNLFALWRPDCCVEEGAHGVALGTEAVIKRWTETKVGNQKAAAALHLASTPVIEVAGNGKTAKGTFLSLGMGSGLISLKERKVREQWCIGKYAIDFIRNPETGEWKIWHLHWYRLIINDYDQGFVSHLFTQDRTEELSALPGRAQTQFHRSLSLTEDTHPFPLPPAPYYDYDGDFRWQYGGEEKEKQYGVEYKHYEKQYNVDYPNAI
jgi:hypothetical protein